MMMQLSGCILAGGRAPRMQGQDKGLVLLGGIPLYQHSVKLLAPQTDDIFINANRNTQDYHATGLRVVADTLPDFPGPLAGMLAGLENALHDWVLFVPCDVPQFPADLAEKLWQQKGDALCAYACDHQRAHPAFALCHRSLITPLTEYLTGGDRKLLLFMDKIGAKAVTFDANPGDFINLNTLAECREWEKQHRLPHPAPLLAVTAYSGTGKTTLLKKLIPQLRESGLRIGLVKHTHHDMDVDTPGKDSYELRKAGAYQTLVVSQERFALMTETPGGAEPDLMQLAARFDTRELDLILVEGFKGESVPKIALFRDVTDRPYQTLLDEFVIAFASDKPRLDVTVPQLDINNITAIRDFIVSWLEHHP